MLRLWWYLLLLAVTLPFPLWAQSTFDLQAYREFLAANRQLSASGVMQLYPAGTFRKTLPPPFFQPEYLDVIRSKYQLTAYEDSLLSQHGFVVTERTPLSTFGGAFLTIWQQDLPVFVSSDAILHAVHMSYDEILLDVERDWLYRSLDAALAVLHDGLRGAATRYGNIPGMGPSLTDVDLYCTVARRLLGRPVQPVFMSVIPAVDSLLQAVADARVRSWRLFSTTPRTVDFSQFTPRGHYTQSDSLKRYFQAMIWLGRSEFYLAAPQSADPGPTEREIQRQTIDAMLVTELASGTGALIGKMDRTIRMFVGEQDNVTIDQIAALARTAGVGSAVELVDSTKWSRFQNALLANPFAFQRINSQILMSDPASPDSLRPASAFMLLGQRFVVDSYVLSNVVYDRVRSYPYRMIPSALDILAALGNDAALQLLQPELEKYQYAPNLAALRYLIDGYDPAFWSSSLYNGWLQAIRALNPPRDRTGLPPFMQTAAWWQRGMNSQLASWAELRHDNLLYAKQSYTGGIVCSYPKGYLEPVPEFYRRIKVFADTARASLAALHPGMRHAIAYFANLSGVADTLAGIAARELGAGPVPDADQAFIRSVLFQPSTMCGAPPDGWYLRIHYTGTQGLDKRDLVIADVHTIPTDEGGSWVGWVLHAGTGPVNLAVITSQLPGGQAASFVGPVMSYYEHMTSGFKRLTDEEWVKIYDQAPSARPSLVNVYLANASGNSRGNGPQLLTDVEPPVGPEVVPTQVSLSRSYPNPFNGETTLHVLVAPRQGSVHVSLRINSIHGQCVRHLIDGPMSAGSYSVRWDGRNDAGGTTASGVYLGTLRSDGIQQVQKLVLIR